MPLLPGEIRNLFEVFMVDSAIRIRREGARETEPADIGLHIAVRACLSIVPNWRSGRAAGANDQTASRARGKHAWQFIIIRARNALYSAT